MEPIDYQVLEAQVEMMDVLNRATRAKTTQRSIHLTPFGQDFCVTVLAPDADPAEHPPHEVPVGDLDRDGEIPQS